MQFWFCCYRKPWYRGEKEKKAKGKEIAIVGQLQQGILSPGVSITDKQEEREDPGCSQEYLLMGVAEKEADSWWCAQVSGREEYH